MTPFVPAVAGVTARVGKVALEAERLARVMDSARAIKRIEGVGDSVRYASGEFKAFKNQKAFVKEVRSAGKDREWHHIVEQRKANVDKFGAEAIYNTNNSVSVPEWVNRRIGDYYSSKDPLVSGSKTVREWLGTQSYEAQYEFGVKILDEFITGVR